MLNSVSVCVCHTAGDSHADRQNKESLMSLYKPWAVEPDLWWLVWTIFPTICHLLKWANSPAVADGKLPRNVTFSCQRSTAEQWAQAMYSHTVQALLNNILQSLSCNFSVLSFSFQWLYSFQKACKCLPVSSSTSLKGTVSERKAFTSVFQKEFRVWEHAASIEGEPAWYHLKRLQPLGHH